jgi:Ulp1 family protease
MSNDNWLSKYIDLVKSTFEFSRFVKRGVEKTRSAKVDVDRVKKEEAVFDAILGEIPPEALKPPGRPKYMILTSEDRTRAEFFFSERSNGNEVIASRNNIQVTRDTLKCLNDREWLNDEVINFYFDMLNDLPVPKRGRPKTFLWNSFFWLKLSDDGKGYHYRAVQRWTSRKKIDLFSFDRFIVPMNIGRNHWALGLVDLKNKRIRYYDSLAAGTVHTGFAEYMIRYLEDEFRDKKKGEECPDLKFVCDPVEPPQQKNGYDCGVFTCMHAECLAAGRDWIDFSQNDIPEMRRKILNQIIENKVG